MAARKLGRGLDVLIPRQTEPTAEFLEVDPKEIRTNPNQPRKRFDADELARMKGSLESDGILQPLVVRRTPQGLELVAGERRLRAALEVPLARVPVIVLGEGVDDRRTVELSLVENLHRQDLNPVELARAFQSLMERYGLTQEAVAERLGKSRPTVANILRVLQLPGEIQEALESGEISLGQAKAMLSVEDDEERLALLEQARESPTTVRDMEAKTLETKSRRGRRKRPAPRPRSAHVQKVEDDLTHALGTRVFVREGKGRGRILIDYYSQEEFERLYELLLAAASGA